MATAKIIMWAYAFMMKAAGIRRDCTAAFTSVEPDDGTGVDARPGP